MINYETLTAAPDSYSLEARYLRFAINILEDCFGWLEEDRHANFTTEEPYASHYKALHHLKKIRPYLVETYDGRTGAFSSLIQDEVIYALHLIESVHDYNRVVDNFKFDVVTDIRKSSNAVVYTSDYKDAVLYALRKTYMRRNRDETDHWVWQSGYTLMSTEGSEHEFVSRNVPNVLQRVTVGKKVLDKINNDFYKKLNDSHHRLVEKSQGHISLEEFAEKARGR